MSGRLKIMQSLLWVYKHSLSPVFYFMGVQCRFTPTCAEYMAQAVEVHGPLRGVALGLRRFCRCHPWGGSGYDPVPPRRMICDEIHKSE